MKNLLLVITVGAFTLGCGGESAKRVDSSVGGSEGGAGGVLTGGTGGQGGSGTQGRDASVGSTKDALTTCPQAAPAPCGGSVVGTWTVRFDECVFPSSSYCPGLTLSVSPTSTFGVVYTFNAGGTANATISGSLIATMRYPPECLYSDAGAVRACQDWSNAGEAALQQQADAGTNNFGSSVVSGSYSCAADSSGICVCDEKVTYAVKTMTGTYSTSGTKLIPLGLSGLGDAGPSDAGSDGPTDYCVSGNTLTLWPPASSSSSKPTVLTR